MPEGFKVGSAFIEVDANPDPAIAKIVKAIRGAKGRVGAEADDLGQHLGRKLGSGVEKQLRLTKGRLSVLGTEIGDQVGSRISTSMDKQLRGAKGRIGNTADGLGQTIGARVSASMSKSLKLGDGIGSGAKAVGTRVGKELGDGVDEGASTSIARSPKIKKALDSVAERTNAQFKALAFVGAFAGLPAAAGIAAAATIGALAAVPLALVAGAAKIQAGNERVEASYGRLAETATTVMKRASSVLVDDLVEGTNRLEVGMRRLEPAITGAFRLAKPAVQGIVDSVMVLTDEALPGVITGLTKTQDAMDGVEALSRGVGRGVSDMFTNMSAGSKSAAVNAGTLGRIVQDLGGFLGTTLANLSNGGTTVLPMFANALSLVYGIVTNLTGSGFSPLVAGVSGFITVVSGALGLIQSLTGGLSGVLSPLLAMIGGFKALDMMSGGKFGEALAAQFSGIGDRIRSAEGARAKFSAGMSGLAAGVFSPVGLAAGALTIGLSLLGAAHQKAAADAAAQKQREGDLAAALRESNGVVNENVRASAAKSLSDAKLANSGKSLLTTANELGVSLPQLTDAYLGNDAAGRKLVETLKSQLAESEKYASSRGEADALQQKKALANDFINTLTDLNGTYGVAVQRNKDLAAASSGTADAMSTMSPALAAAQQGAGKLASAYTTLYSPMANVGDKANALITILDRLAGRTPSYEESVQSLNDTLRGMADALAAGMDQTKGWGAELVNADGTVNTMTANGSTLQNQLVSLQSGFANAGASIQGLVESGMTYTDAAARVRSDLTLSRDKFIDMATTMLGNRDAAVALADKYGLLPEQVVTKVTDLGSAIITQTDVTNLDAKLKGLPPNTPVRVTSITAEAEQKLKDVGYTVTHMPDGTVIIYGNPTNALSAANEVESRVQAIRDKTVYVNVVTTGVGAAASAVAQAAANAAAAVGNRRSGGPSRPDQFKPRARATGGPTPYLSGLAGARMTGEAGPEIDFPSRSTYVATAQQTQRMESDAKAGALALQDAGTVTGGGVTNNYYNTFPVTAPPSMDLDALALKVSRRVERMLKGGK